VCSPGKGINPVIKKLVAKILQRLNYTILSNASINKINRRESALQSECAGLRQAHERALAESSIHRNSLELENRRPSLWPLVAFMHLPKTAGLSITEALLPFFNPKRVLAHWYFAADGDPVSSGVLESIDFLGGHFTFNHTKYLRSERVLFSFVREPVDRVLSHYWFARSWKQPLDDAVLQSYPKYTRDFMVEVREFVETAKRCSLLDFVRSDNPVIRNGVENLQTYAFASDYRSERTGNDSLALKTALAHLDEFALVGLTERSDECFALMCQMMNWPKIALPKVNETVKRSSIKQLNARELEAILERNQLDLVLYEHVRSRIEEKLPRRQEWPNRGACNVHALVAKPTGCYAPRG
jgi:hypothetical protein